MWRRAPALIGVVFATALAGCASDWEERYEALQKEQLSVIMENDELKTSRAELASQAEAMRQQLEAQDREVREARSAADEAARRANELAGSASSAPSAPVGNESAILSRTASEIAAGAGGTGRVTPEGNIEITLDSDVTFGPGRAELTEAGKKSLRSISSSLRGQFGAYQIRVEGHTDADPVNKTKPKYGDNFGLGSARSLDVVRFMETELAIEPTRLMSASRGEHEPVASNTTNEGKKQNRRVEIVVVIPRESALSMAK